MVDDLGRIRVEHVPATMEGPGRYIAIICRREAPAWTHVFVEAAKIIQGFTSSRHTGSEPEPVPTPE